MNKGLNGKSTYFKKEVGSSAFFTTNLNKNEGGIYIQAKNSSNYQVNKFLTRIGVGTIKVGLKNLKGLTKQFASLENNHIATVINNSVTGWI